MEWWEQIRIYEAADEAFAAGESPPPSTTSQIEDETIIYKKQNTNNGNVETLTDL